MLGSLHTFYSGLFDLVWAGNEEHSGVRHEFPMTLGRLGPLQRGRAACCPSSSLSLEQHRTQAASSGKETPPFPTSTSSYFVFCITVILKLQRLLIFCHIYLPSQIEYTLSFGIVQRNQTEPEKEAPFLGWAPSWHWALAMSVGLTLLISV